MKKNRALFILHYSPPVHGASKVGDYIVHSKVINKNLETKFIKIKSSKKIDEIGKLNIFKIYYLIELLTKVSFQLILFRPRIIYYTASPHGFAFYRDLIITLPIKIYNLFTKSKIFYHYHAKGIKDFTKTSNIKLKLTNFLVNRVNLIFISKLMEDEIKKLKNYKKVYYLSNGVKNKLSDNEFIEILIEKEKIKGTNILYLSNMIKDKGYNIVLDLAKQMGNRQDVQINFAGSWASSQDEQYFINYVNNHDLKEIVTYHGLVKGDKKKMLFSNATVFVFPSNYKKEVFPLSVLEALSYGVPILTFDIGAMREIINDKIGLISNKDCIFEDLNKMILLYQSDDTYKNCRKEYINNYTIDVFEEKLLKILKSN